MVYFTADMHFGHRAIINMQSRPFESVEEMNRVLLDYSDAPEAPVRIVGKHLSGLRDALRQHICGEAALELHSDDSP